MKVDKDDEDDDKSGTELQLILIVERVANENEIEWNIEFYFDFLFVGTRSQ